MRALGGLRDRPADRRLAQRESVFALSNGHIGLRGNLDEGEPYGLPGTYLAGFYELRPLPYGESGYGYPEEGQTVVNVTNGKIIRLLVEDEPFDVRYGTLESHERVLDLQAGLLKPHARLVVARAPSRARQLDAPRLLRPAGDRGDPLHRRVARRSHPDRRAVRARRQRVGAGRRGRSARRRGAGLAAALDVLGRLRHQGGADAHHQVERADDRRRDGPRARGATRHRRVGGGLRGRRAADRDRHRGSPGSR